MEFTGERFIECEETAGQLIEREHWQRYMVAAKLVEPGAAVLDIACGSGYGTAYLSRFAGHVYGVDISSDAVAYAEGRYGRPNLRFLQGDVSQIPLDSGSVDLVVSFETIEHVEEASQHAFLAEAKRVLRPGGRLIVSCPNQPVASDLPNELWGAVNPYHKKEYTEEGFRTLLAAYFPAVSMLYQRNEISLVMDAPGVDTLSVQWGERKRHDDTQNLIAVCAEKAVDVRPFSCMVPDISSQYMDSQKTLAEYVHTVQRQSEDINRLAAEKAGLVGRSRELELVIAGKDEAIGRNSAYIQELEAAIAGKDEAVGRNSAYIQELEAAIAGKDEAMGRNSAYIQELEAAIAGKDEAMGRNSAYIQELEAAIAGKDEAIEQNSAYIQTLAAALSQKDGEITASTARVQELEEMVKEQQDTIADILRLKQAANEEVKRLQADVETAQGQLDALWLRARQMMRRIAELETIEQSRIWRMTGPVRWLADQVKRFVK